MGSICFSAINASRSETRAGVDGMLFDLLTMGCAGRERVTDRVTDRNGSGDFERMDLAVAGDDEIVRGFVVKRGERN